MTPPLERRRDEWIQGIAEGLTRLEANKGVRVEDLKENPVFLDTLLQATHAVLRTHQTEKREALRAARRILAAYFPRLGCDVRKL